MDLLKIGQKLSINIVKEDKLIEIISTITNILDDRLVVELPPYFMRYIEFLEAGKPLTIKVFSKLGTIDFNTIVISSPLEEDNFEIELDYNAMKLTPGEELPKVEAIENLKILTDDFSFNTQTFEISTEYIKFYSDKSFKIDDTFNCELKLPDDYGTIKFKATVTSIDIVYSNEYTASIYSMNEQDRETLLYYMYVYINNYSQE